MNYFSSDNFSIISDSDLSGISSVQANSTYDENLNDAAVSVAGSVADIGSSVTHSSSYATTQFDSDDSILNGSSDMDSVQFDSDDDISMSPKNTSTPKTASSTAKRRRISQPVRSPLVILNYVCCEDRCLNHLSIDDVVCSEQKFKALSTETKQTQYILDVIREHSYTRTIKTTKTVVHTNLVLKGKRVCAKAWRHVHNVTEDRWNTCKRKFIQGVVTVTHKNSGRTGFRDKTSAAIAWMRYLFERIGDYMPHKEEICLPSCYTKKSLYQRMVTEFHGRSIQQQSIICYDYFAAIWRIHLSEFVISKNNGFVKCGVCKQLEELAKLAKTEHERTRVKMLIKLHMEQVEKERKRYHYHREKAENEPEELLAIIIDGMDQNKTNLPHFIDEDKDISHLWRLRTHITGSIVHTGVASGKIPFAHVDVNQLPHDSNLTMNLLLEILSEVKNHLAKVLYLQLDNCFRENKNRYLLSLMEMMVELDIFDEILVSFLPVGHTHENVDQMFSKISTQLKKTNTYTLNDLESTVVRSYSPTIKYRNIDKKPTFNIKDWLLPHMSGRLQGHSKPHNFRFYKANGTAYMQYRLWCTDPWEPLDIDVNGEQIPGLKCLKNIPDRMDIPEFVTPTIERLDIVKLKKDVPHGFGIRLPTSANQWWNQYLENINDLAQVPSEVPNSWLLYDVKDYADEKRLIRQEIQEEPEVIQHVNEIEDRLTRPCQRVTIGGLPAVADHVDNFDSIIADEMVAVYCPDFQEIPQIGKVTKRDGEHFTIHWYKGSWTTMWKPLFSIQGKKKKVPTATLR